MKLEEFLRKLSAAAKFKALMNGIIVSLSVAGDGETAGKIFKSTEKKRHGGCQL